MTVEQGHKGVMLCERPGPTSIDKSPGLAPFKPSSATEQIDPVGLCPVKKILPVSNTIKPQSVTSKHIKYVHGLDAHMRDERMRMEEEAQQQASKTQAFTDFSKTLRTAILNGYDVSTTWRPAAQAATLRNTLAQPKTLTQTAQLAVDPQASALLKSSMADFVEQVFSEATEKLQETMNRELEVSLSPEKGGATQTNTGCSGLPAAAEGSGGASSSDRPATASKAPKAKRAKGNSKPAWALTEDEVAAQEVLEEGDLLSFAADLDFDGYVSQLDDVELQDTFKALQEAETGHSGDDGAWRKNFVRAMNHVALKQAQRQAQGKQDDDLCSMAGESDTQASTISRATHASKLKSEAAASRRATLSQKGEEGGFDTSSRACEDVGRAERAASVAREAADFLRENPELKGIHSTASVRAIIEKAESYPAIGATA